MSRSGKWAVILGGSSGMGWASAQRLAEAGFNLCLLHRNRKSESTTLEKAFDTLREKGVQCLTFNKDALRAEVREEVLERLEETMQQGKVHLLLHSIAKGNLKPMAPLPPDEIGQTGTLSEAPGRETDLLQPLDFAITIEAMATSFYSWVKTLHQNKLFAPEAMALALTSEGSYKAWRNYAAVGAAKAALEAISRSMALEYAPYGIRSNIIQAGITDTRALRLIEGHEKLLQQSVLRNPFGRLTTPEDVAQVVYLMSRPEALWINGAIIPVDGGESIA